MTLSLIHPTKLNYLGHGLNKGADSSTFFICIFQHSARLVHNE